MGNYNDFNLKIKEGKKNSTQDARTNLSKCVCAPNTDKCATGMNCYTGDCYTRNSACCHTSPGYC